MIEAGIPVPSTPSINKKEKKDPAPAAATGSAKSDLAKSSKVEKIEKNSLVSTKAENEVILDQKAEVDRKKKKVGPTTLTIV
jgi:hypothetical protein